MHSTQDWNANLSPWREAPSSIQAGWKLESGTEGFLAMSQVEKQLVSQGGSGISEYTRVNIECEMLYCTGTGIESSVWYSTCMLTRMYVYTYVDVCM